MDRQLSDTVLPAKSSDEFTIFHGKTVIILNEVLILQVELLLPVLKY